MSYKLERRVFEELNSNPIRFSTLKERLGCSKLDLDQSLQRLREKGLVHCLKNIGDEGNRWIRLEETDKSNMHQR